MSVIPGTADGPGPMAGPNRMGKHWVPPGSGVQDTPGGYVLVNCDPGNH